MAGPWGAYAVKDSKKNKETISISLNTNIYPGDLTTDFIHELMDRKSKGHDSLGKDPHTNQPIYLLTGRYGPYVQRGDAKEDKKDVKRVSIPKKLDLDNIDLSIALKLLKLPQTLGNHPQTKQEIKKGIGRFGPYVVHNGDFRSVKDVHEFLDLNLKQAIKVLDQPKKGRKITVLKDVGYHPETGSSIQILDGKFGPYIKSAGKKVSLPKTFQPKSITLKQALELLSLKKKNSKGKLLVNGKAKNGTGIVKRKLNINKNASIASTKRRKIKKTYKTVSETVS